MIQHTPVFATFFTTSAVDLRLDRGALRTMRQHRSMSRFAQLPGFIGIGGKQRPTLGEHKSQPRTRELRSDHDPPKDTFETPSVGAAKRRWLP
jgi:hypothetical protein